MFDIYDPGLASPPPPPQCNVPILTRKPETGIIYTVSAQKMLQTFSDKNFIFLLRRGSKWWMSDPKAQLSVTVVLYVLNMSKLHFLPPQEVGGGCRKCKLEPSRFYICFFFWPPPPPPKKKKMKSDTLGVPQLTLYGGPTPQKKCNLHFRTPPCQNIG